MQQLEKCVSLVYSLNPTERLGILEHQDMSIDVSELHKASQAKYFHCDILGRVLLSIRV